MAKRKAKTAVMPAVVMCSMWQNDVERRLVDRVEHLLAKAETYPHLRFVWVVGDSTDGTQGALTGLSKGYDVEIVAVETGIEGNGTRNRMRRLSETANEYFNFIDDRDDYVLVHESDIASPGDVVNQLVAHAEDRRCPIAAWPVIELNGYRLFYDHWAFRKDGVRFRDRAPYHECYRTDEPFEVDSFGTLFLFDADDAKHLHMEDQAVLDLCRQLKEQGLTLWVAPEIVVQQPTDLWMMRGYDG